MATRSSAEAQSDDRVLVITRVFDAPRSLVFKAWTDPKHLEHWWGPTGFTLPSCTNDVRPGGAYRLTMRSPEGVDFFNSGVYREVVEPELLVMAGCWTDAAGRPTSPQMVTTVTFEEFEGKTRLTLTTVGFDSNSERDSHRGGFSASFDRLANYLASLR